MTLENKPRLKFWQILNMSFGFLGIQFGFALQNGNASRILEIFGAHVEHLSLFWLAAPITGMIVQPIIGYYSDRTWTKLGRRRPFFLVGAILASIALVFMPNADILTTVLPALYIGAGILMVMDASFNVAMEPFRALVADLLPSDQRTMGFAIQSCLIGVGAVAGSWLPYVMAEWLGVTRSTSNDEVSPHITYSFITGAAIFLGTILWTIITTKESPPSKNDKSHEHSGSVKGLGQILKDFRDMPKTMKQLGVVQFFSWFALFSMWVFTTTAVRTHIYNLPLGETNSDAAYKAGDWVSGMFGVYNGVAAVYALFLPVIAKWIGRKKTHAVSLAIGGMSLISIYFVSNPADLVYPMVGIGIAWASILAMPYAILAGAIPPMKMGVYMGIFNFFITFPQIVNGFVGGLIVKYLYGSEAIYSLVTAGVCLLIAAFSVRFVEDKDDLALQSGPE